MTSSTCAGCTACRMVCPKHAICFVEDVEGFVVPHIDLEKCVDCGMCIKACPALIDQNISPTVQSKSYALQYHDETVRKNSASGALFPAFANYFINTLHGYVCGCILDENLVAKHIVSNKWEDIARMQDSKYVQSNMESCLDEIIRLLKEGHHVLFTGTSCQVNGLLSVIKIRNVDENRLLTIDFFCHGVPSPKVWKNYVQYYENLKGFKVDGFKFRNKTYGWGKGTQSRGTGYLSTWKWKGTYHEDYHFIARMWPRIFFSNLCLRSYCHSCPYTKVDKPSDITMGDFWGIEDFHPKFDDHKGCSMAIIRSAKAEQILHQLKNTVFMEVALEEVINKQGNAYAPSKPNPLRKQFWVDYNNMDFESILAYYFNYNAKTKLKSFIKYMLFKLRFSKYSY